MSAFPTQDVISSWSRSVSHPGPAEVVFARSGAFDGRILFQGNQVAIKLRSAPTLLLTGCLFLSFDDIAVENNQFVTEAAAVFVHVLAWGFSARLVGNRVNEYPLTTLYSGWTVGQQALTSLNQATHCLFTTGIQSSSPNNQVAINLLCEQLTWLGKKIVAGGQ